MSIGDTFPYTVPVIGSANWGTTVNNVLNELITRTASKVPFTAMQGSTLPMGNVPIADIKYSAYYEQPVTPATSPVGRIEYYNGNFYMVTASGAIQVTSGTGLNAAGVGGITGDYGGANPASLRFVDASLRYDFYDDYGAGTWAYIRARAVDIAAGATSANRARLSFGGAASLDFTLPSTLPAANRSVVVVSNTGQIEHNDGTNTVTNDIYLGGTTKIRHGDRVVVFAPAVDNILAGTFSTSTNGIVSCTGAGGTSYMKLNGFQVGWRIKSVKIYYVKSSAAATTFTVRDQPANTNLGSQVINVAGSSSVSVALGAGYTITDANSIWLTTAWAAATDEMRTISVTYDIP